MTAMNTYSEPQRLQFPVHEAEHEWLGYLLDAYHRADIGVTESIETVLRSVQLCFKCLHLATCL